MANKQKGGVRRNISIMDGNNEEKYKTTEKEDFIGEKVTEKVHNFEDNLGQETSPKYNFDEDDGDDRVETLDNERDEEKEECKDNSTTHYQQEENSDLSQKFNGNTQK